MFSVHYSIEHGVQPKGAIYKHEHERMGPPAASARGAGGDEDRRWGLLFSDCNMKTCPSLPCKQPEFLMGHIWGSFVQSTGTWCVVVWSEITTLWPPCSGCISCRYMQHVGDWFLDKHWVPSPSSSLDCCPYNVTWGFRWDGSAFPLLTNTR